jgi:type I restriction enzyme S subunit
MSFPRYERYKHSGVEWLGEVPEHWALGPLYSLGTEREESNAGLIDDNLLSLSYGRIVTKDIGASDGLLPESFETYQIAHPGDIIFRLTDLQNDKRSLRTAIVCERGIITFAYVAFAPRAILPAYLNYLLRDYDLRKVFYSMGGGVRQSMKFEDIRRLPTLVPPKHEQSAIANFLCRETGKIDALIEEQRRLIELLKEKRQAIISHAVTKGFKPHIPMKDSGLLGLGTVPEHWEVLRLKELCQPEDGIQMGPFGGMLLRLDTEDTGFKVYGQQNTISGNFNLGDRWISRERYESLQRYSLLVGDIVLTRKGSLGNARLVEYQIAPGIIDSDTIRIRLQEQRASSSFVTLLFHEAFYVEWEIDTMKRGAILSGVNSNTIANLFIALPPRTEQDDIMKALGARLERLHQLVEQAEDTVHLLLERRSALISAAVTGKIDVRDYTPNGAA